MTVLDMIRKEFNVDESRIYLMGHSMGGAGTYYLGSKHANIWAGLAPIAPAAMAMTNDRVKVLQAIKDARVPMLVSMGDADEAVPVANVRTWVETMNELGLNYEYKEYPRRDPRPNHGRLHGGHLRILRQALESGALTAARGRSPGAPSKTFIRRPAGHVANFISHSRQPPSQI
jgi:predicted peptidase